jgi:hypothetical protein
MLRNETSGCDVGSSVGPDSATIHQSPRSTRKAFRHSIGANGGKSCRLRLKRSRSRINGQARLGDPFHLWRTVASHDLIDRDLLILKELFESVGSPSKTFDCFAEALRTASLNGDVDRAMSRVLVEALDGYDPARLWLRQGLRRFVPGRTDIIRSWSKTR